MEDFYTLAKLHPDDVSNHAVSLAVLAWALNDAFESRGCLDRHALHRAADLALAVYREEQKRFESIDSPARLLDTLYLKAFLSDEPPQEQPESASEGIAARFHFELNRLLYQRISAPGAANANPVSRSI
ncbi:MAG TPA: hypothetical protein VIY53_07050 [Acidobacteriaceae bacterium]